MGACPFLYEHEQQAKALVAAIAHITDLEKDRDRWRQLALNLSEKSARAVDA